MRADTVQEKLTEILRDVFDDEELVATPQLSSADVDEWDSLNHVRFMLTVEREFGIKLAASEMTGLKNIGELMHLIQFKAV